MAKIDFNKMRAQKPATDIILNPLDLFASLPDKDPNFDYLRGPQDQVLRTWQSRRGERDISIKMNTGGGKTIVGLLIAKSLINEGEFPTAYLVPDEFLKKQVIDEAQRLGLAITDNPRDSNFQQGKAILVDTFARLFNAKSVFGIDSSVHKQQVCQLNSLVMDDAHACLAKADQTFRLTIDYKNDVYRKLFDLFAEDLKSQSPNGFLDLKSRKRDAMIEIPFWSWQQKKERVLEILHPLADTELEWSWSLLVDSLPLCTAVIASDSIDIHPPCYPTDTLKGFAEAKRRVYLTATLADDSVLVRHFGADPSSVADPISPSNAGDIGDRMILVPQKITPAASDIEVREFVVEAAKKRNVVVIVPSKRRAEWWNDEAAMVLDRNNINEGVSALRSNPNLGLVVFINRYDGIDLPGDACHFLVLDGLPEAIDGGERLEQVQMGNSASVLARQIQRLEQGMGRATRSNNDFSVVLLLGSRLAERLNNYAARRMFSPATRIQLEMADWIAENMELESIADLNDVIDQCLNRDESWIVQSKGQLAQVRYESPMFNNAAQKERAAFRAALIGDFHEAEKLQSSAIEGVKDNAYKGILLQRKAAYTNFFDPSEAQGLQKKAKDLNSRLLQPLSGITYERLSGKNRPQAEQASYWLQNNYESGNDLVLEFNALASELSWNSTFRQFEQALHDLAWHIGIAGQRPEITVGKGPDGLWAFQNGSFFIIEAKNEAETGHPVSKDDAKQTSNAVDWFNSHYPSSSGTPILIHPESKFDFHAAVPVGCRVITHRRLINLSSSLSKFAARLTANFAYRDPKRISALLANHGFTQDEFIKRFTEAGRPEKR